MLRVFIEHEIQNNLFNLRFLIGLILCIVLTISCTAILTHDYKKEMQDYALRRDMQDDFLDNYAHTNRLGPLMRQQKPPENTRPFIIGMQRDADLGSFDDNPLPALFPPLDLIFIVTIIMSLMAILFAYDAVTGEKEKGTLKLMLSNPFSRAVLLLGKWIGGTVTLFIPFLLSIILGTIYIVLHPAVQWDISTWLSFALVVLASMTFISIWFLLGLMVSSHSRTSSTSILTSLFLWVLLILVIPNISPYIAAQLIRIPSVNRIENERSRILGVERDDLGRSMLADLNRTFDAQYGEPFNRYLNMGADQKREAFADPVLKAMIERYRDASNQLWREANEIQGEKARRLSAELNNRAAVQTTLAKYIACISPYANYIYLATDLTGTGLRSQGYFNRTTNVYFNQFRPYLERRVNETRQSDLAWNSNAFIDIKDRPRFTFEEEPVGGKLTAVLPFWGILLFFNVLFFGTAFVLFLRYDVR